MEAVMTGLTWKIALIYLDDIIVFSPTFERHLEDLRQVLDRLRQANLRLKPSKCHQAQRQISYLGHKVSAKGISVDPQKVAAVQSYPRPQNLKDLRSFLGMTGYYRCFIKSYATIANPLYHLTKNGVPFVWSEACEGAFQKLKDSLTGAPVLVFLDFNKPFQVHTDASGFSIGAVLLQEQDDKSVRPVTYAGRSLNEAERNYGITEKECLALIYAVKQFDCYLCFNQFSAVVDHAAFQWLLNLKQPSGHLARWISLLQALNFTILCHPGQVHSDADGLSRRSYLSHTDPHTQEGPTEIEPHDDDVTAIHTASTAAPPTNTRTHRSKQPTQCLVDAARAIQVDDLGSEELSINVIRQKQREAPQYVDVIAYLDVGSLPSDQAKRTDVLSMQSSYFLHNDVLFHILTKDGKGHRTIRTQVQLVIPKALVQTVLQITHDSPVWRPFWTKLHTGVHTAQVFLAFHEQGHCTVGQIMCPM